MMGDILFFLIHMSHHAFQTVTKTQVMLTTKGGWEKSDKSPPKNKRERKGKKTKIYEVFMSMNYHSFSL